MIGAVAQITVRLCGDEGIENVTSASTFRNEFGDASGVAISDGPMAGLMSGAVVVVVEDPGGNVTSTEQVPEIAQEPDDDAALAAIG